MKYISDIKVNGKSVDYTKYPLNDTDNVTITIHDIETGETEKFNNIDFLIADCYGFADGPDCLDYYFTRHTNVTVQLYKYIKWVKIYEGTSMLPSGSADSCISDMQDAPSRVLEVYCGNDQVYPFRPLGSSVGLLGDGTVLSLYNFLISMCRGTNLNIMAYGAVRFFYSDENR